VHTTSLILLAPFQGVEQWSAGGGKTLLGNKLQRYSSAAANLSKIALARAGPVDPMTAGMDELVGLSL